MKGWLTCNICGISFSWEHLEHNFAQIKEFHDRECDKPRPTSINLSELAKDINESKEKTSE